MDLKSLQELDQRGGSVDLNYLQSVDKGPRQPVSPAPSAPGFAEIGQDFLAPIKDPSLALDTARAGVANAISGFSSAMADQQRYESPIYEQDPQDLEDAKIWEGRAEDFKQYGELLQERVDKKYQPKTRLGQIAKGLTQSSPSMLAGLAASFLGGPAAGYAIGAGLGTGSAFSWKYKERTEMGDSPEDKLGASLLHGITEGASELIGLPAYVKLFKAAKAGAKLTPAAIREAAMEGVEEVVAGIPQGLEDAYRGQGKDPAGIQGIKDYISSGQMAQQLVDDFVGGAMMGGGTSIALKPVQMSYKPAAIRRASMLKEVADRASAEGLTEIDAGNGTVVPLSKIEEQISELQESFGIKDEQLVPEQASVEAENQEILNKAVERLKEGVKPKTKEESPVAEPVVEEPVTQEQSSTIDAGQSPIEETPQESVENLNTKLPAVEETEKWVAENGEKITAEIKVKVQIRETEKEMSAATAYKMVDTQYKKLEQLLDCLRN